MKKTLITVGIIAAIVFVVYRFFAGSYNKMVELDQALIRQWAQVENVYQRRLDLIPNLVNTVKGAADFEKSTLTAVIEARASATQMKVDPKNLSADELEKFQASQGQLSQALGRLMVVAEQYPQLRATEAFRDLTVQLEGTENRITIERKSFNEAVQAYNTLIMRFPNNMLANMYGFKEKSFFSSVKGAEKAPEVKF